MRTTILSFGAALAIFGGQLSWSQAALTDQARALLAKNQSQAAVEMLEAAPDNVKQSSDVAFLLGVAYQQLATQATNADAKANAARKAEQAYVLTLPPTNAPIVLTAQTRAVFNNLASLQVALGNDARAREYFQSATGIAGSGQALRGVGSTPAGRELIADPRGAYYALNYARFLETRDVDSAIEIAGLAFQAAPQSAEARDYVGNLLWRNRIGEMLGFARALTDQGFPQISAQWAIKCLSLGNRPPEERRAWLVLYAQDVAHGYRYNDLTANWRDDLRPIVNDPVIGVGVKQLGDALTLPPTSPPGWWNNQQTISSLKTTPKDAMRELFRARAENLLADADKGNDRTAERYLMAAIEMGARGPDPENFLRLVELYAKDDAHEQLTRLMERYEGELFSEKGQAYRDNDWPLIYRMHLALGMTYAHIGAWNMNHPFRNPFFQLESAQKAADQLNQQAERQGKKERVALPPIAVKQLAEGYTRINRPDQALKVRMDGVDRLQKAGFTRESAPLLDSIPADQLQLATPTTRTQIDKFKGIAVQPRM